MGSLCNPGLTGPLAKHNKMLEYLNLCLLCAIFALILYLYARVKRYLPLLKMAEELIGNLHYETPQAIAAQAQSATKRQNSPNVFSPEIASCIWVRFTQKNSLPNLVKKKWKNFLIIMKLSCQARWCVR